MRNAAIYFDEALNYLGQQGMFANLDEMLMFDRSEQATNYHDGRWIALSDNTDERVEVKLTTVKKVKRADDSIGDVLFFVKASDINDPKQYWDSKSRKFINIPFGS